LTQAHQKGNKNLIYTFFIYTFFAMPVVQFLITLAASPLV